MSSASRRFFRSRRGPARARELKYLAPFAQQRAQVGQRPQLPQLVRVGDRVHVLDPALRDVDDITPISLSSRSKNTAPGCPFTSSRRQLMPKRVTALILAISVRVTLERPWSARASAGDLPPPSPRSTTSWASSSSSPSRSPGRRPRRNGSLTPPAARARPRTGASLLHVAAGPCGELAGVLLARPDDLRDPLVRLVEHLPQEGGALLGRQALEEDEEGEL
jgi:hypothetical protein